jgi:protein O-mannosyl-transferase
VSAPSFKDSDRAHAVLGCAGLSVLVVLLFGRVLGHPFIAFDDAEYILRNPQITHPGSAPIDLLLTPKTGYVIPVTVGFEALLHWLSRGQAWSFHAAGVLLHALFVCQLFMFARRLGTRSMAAFAAASLFAVHPLVVQPVAWAVCIKDLLMANLLLAATHAFLTSTGGSPRPIAGVAAVVLALLAMLAKPSAALLGFVWLGYLVARRLAHAPVQRDLPLQVAGLTAVLGVIVGIASRYAHDSLTDSERGPWSLRKPVEVLGRQLWHVLWPADLLIAYPDPLREPEPLLGALGLVALGSIGYLLVRLRASPAELLPFSLALATYIPTSNVLPFARTMSDSYMYVPLAGLVLLLTMGATRLLAERTRRSRRVTAIAVAALVLALAASSSAQLGRWRGGLALWEPVVRRHPRLALAHRLMGDEMVFRGQPELAIEPYRRAFALQYDRRFLLEYGTALGMAGRLADAECVLIEAVAFDDDSGYSVYNYAALLAFNDDYHPRQEGVAKQLLERLDTMRAAGKVQWPAALEPGLELQLARVRDAPPPPSWPQRNCAMLKGE